jgi:hypothetical protein
MEGDMAAEIQAMQSLLLEICDLGATTEEKGITKLPPFNQLIQRAQDLGIGVSSSATLDDLRTAVENACTDAMAGDTAVDNPIKVKMILGNETGVPGDGP